MRVLVAGGRDFEVLEFIVTRMLRLHEKFGFTEVITGGARGVDTLAHMVAEELGIPTRVFPISKADWTDLGRAAGPIRNKQMLVEGKPELVMAFPGGAGTANMVQQSLMAKVPVWKSEQIMFNSKVPKYDWLSNMATGFEFVDSDGCVWATSEHYYQSRKIEDEHLRGMIQVLPSPFEAKKRANSFKEIEGWNPPPGEPGGLKEVAMREALAYKYSSGSAAAKKLLGTGEDYLVEYAPWGDTFWGTTNGIGLNRLGWLLMERRDQLRELQ